MVGDIIPCHTIPVRIDYDVVLRVLLIGVDVEAVACPSHLVSLVSQLVVGLSRLVNRLRNHLRPVPSRFGSEKKKKTGGGGGRIIFLSRQHVVAK